MMTALIWLTAGAILGPIIGRWLHALGAADNAEYLDWRDEAEAERAGVLQNGPQSHPESRHVDLFGDSEFVVSADAVAAMREWWVVHGSSNK